MEKTVLFSLPIDELQSVIIDCVNSCLKNSCLSAPTATKGDLDLLTVEQAAEFLHLSVPTIYGLISKGEIPVMKRSKRCYFTKADLLDYLKHGRKSSVLETAKKADDYITRKGK